MAIDIAIIGLSGVYPDACDVEQFYSNLAQGLDSVRPLSQDRLGYLTFTPSREFSAVAALDRIDAFDHEFFKISLKEAEYMDPQQRLLLQLACAAIENAGYALGEMRGSETGVFIAASNTDFYRLLDAPDPVAVSGNLPSALAGRISYQLGLHGPALVIDTACSSSLVAVAEACSHLSSGNVEFALAGGVSLFFLEDPLAGSVGIASSDGKCKTFDASADGSGWGEGGGIVLLAPLQRALEERLPIQAVIKGIAVNQDAERSNGITAPSPIAQSEAIGKAWRMAGFEAESIGCVEAHGTGTELGDPIEVQGLDLAFGHKASHKGFCAVGSVKTNIGHLMGAAGIAGLTKAVLALKKRKLLPSLHYRRANPYIDFEKSALYVNTELRDWELNGTKLRRAGVSSFGLSGTNAHLALEEAPAPIAEPSKEVRIEEVPLTLSAKTPAALERYLHRLEGWLEGCEARLADIAYTLNRGRDDHAYRYAQWARSKAELGRKIRAHLANGDHPAPEPASPRQVVFLFSDASGFDPDWSRRLAGTCPGFAQSLESLGKAADGLEPCRELELFFFQMSLHQMWTRCGISASKVIGSGPGSAVVGVIQEKLDLDAGLIKAASFDSSAYQPNLSRLRQVVAQLLAQDPAPVFLEVGAEGKLFRELDKMRQREFPHLRVLRSLEEDDSTLVPALCRLYRMGVSVDWKAFYRDQARSRTELPTYPFEETSCWNPAILKSSAPASESASNRGRGPRPQEELLDVLEETDATEAERRLAAIWAENLKVKRLSLESDYFDLGGDSLTGIQAVNRIEESFGIEFDFDLIYDFPTIGELARKVQELRAQAAPAAQGEPDTAGSIRMPSIEPAPAGAELPLSMTEQRIWFLDQFEPGSAFYNIPFALRVGGPLEPAWIERSLKEIAGRHAVLRTTFPTVEGRPQRRIRSQCEVPFRTTDLSGLPPRDRESRLEKLSAEEAAQGFDLTGGPLWRVHVVRLASEDHALLLTMHHIISDLWSVNLLIRELTILYQAYSQGESGSLPDLPIQYADFAYAQQQWLSGETLDALVSYWKSSLGASPPLLALPAERPRPPVQTFRGKHFHFAFPARLTADLKELGRGRDATLFMVLMAGFQALLHRYTGESVIPVGTPVAGRSRVETEALIGFFANTLVLAADLEGDPSVGELLTRVRDISLGAFGHQELPFEKLLEEVHPQRSLSHSPIFQVMFALQNIAIEVPDLPGLSIRISEPDSGTAQFDLTLSMREDEDGLAGRVQYNCDLFEAGTIERFVRHLQRLLAAMASGPDRRVSHLPLWPEDERRQMLARWNDSAQDYPDRAQCLHHLIEEQARRTPHRTAVIFGRREIRYDQLVPAARGLARRLAALGVGPESVVGICAERCMEMVVGLLGILQAGAAYLPIDPHTPAQRLEYMLDNSGATAILAPRAALDGVAGRNLSTIALEDVWSGDLADSDPAAAEEQAPSGGRAVGGHNAAYVIYTSGTTGNPKGVLIPHRGIVNRLLWMQQAYNLGHDDRVLQKTPFTFDVSVWEFFWPLMAGATLVVARPEGHRDPAYLIEAIREHRITTLHFVPSMLNAFLQSGLIPSLPSLRRVICSGEALGLDHVRRFFGAVSAQLHNLYGPTEASVDVSCWQCLAGQDLRTVPIGRPIANTALYVLDAGMTPVPVGVAGELHIGGVGLARGYVSAPAQTAAGFVPDPFAGPQEAGSRLYRTGDQARWMADGSIEFLGRRDHQLKIRGFRIEAAEVEAALCTHEGIREAVVAAFEHEGHRSLIAYLVAAGGAPPTHSAIQLHLKERLPEYMLPAQFLFLESLPLNANGKADRSSLPAPSETPRGLAPDYEAPRNETEEKLAQIWSELLSAERVGIRDNFFELGGDSILSIQAVARSAEQGIILTPRQMFECQTIAQLASQAGRAGEVLSEQGDLSGPAQLGPAQLWLLEAAPRDLSHWNQAVMLAGDGDIDTERLLQALQALCRHHDALRHRFAQGEAQEWEQICDPPPGRLGFEWKDLSGLDPMERQEEIRRLCRSAQESLDLERGPLISALGMTLDADWRLLLVIHHLAVDGVSWRILLEDLQKAYSQLSLGEQAQLGAKTTSFRQWTRRMAEVARSRPMSAQTDYWLEAAQGESWRLPREGDGENLESTARSVALSLGSQPTGQLLQAAPQAYGASMQEALLSALTTSLLHWSGSRSGRIRIELEGHGREELFEPAEEGGEGGQPSRIDLTRTVGWFTAIYPVALQARAEEGPQDSLKRIKEQLRAVPSKGAGYGLLRYLGPDEDRSRLSDLPQPEIGFNYLGQLDQVLSSRGPFRAAAESVGPSRSGRGRRPHVLDFSAEIAQGELNLRCTYSSNLHGKESIERLLQLTRQRLELLIEHCLSPEAGGYTPSDFPDEDLSDRELEGIFAQIANRD